MSDTSGLQLDADGFVDMDQFPDDGSDLATEALADLRSVLHADPVDEPTPEAWDAMFDEVLTGTDDGPFGLEDGLVSDDLVADGGLGPDDGTAFLDADDSATDDGTDGDGLDDDGLVDDLDDGGLGLDDPDGDLDVDGILEVTPDDGAPDPYDIDGTDIETPADISHDFEDTL